MTVLENCGSIVHVLECTSILYGFVFSSYERYEHKRSLAGNDFAPLGDIQNNPTALNGGAPIAAANADILANSPNPLGQTDIRYGLMPNYPYNDMGIDPYLIYRGNGDVRVSEAPSFGMPALIYDHRASGSQAYIRLANEIIKQNNNQEAA